MYKKLSLSTLILGYFLTISSTSLATTYTTVASGKWDQNNIWDQNGSPGSYWGASDQVIILHDVELKQNLGFAGTLTVTSSGSIIGSNKNISLYDNANLTADGEVDIKMLDLNSISNATLNAALTVKNHLNIGSNSNLTANAAVSVGNHLNNNGGTVIFNQEVNIDGNLSNNNGRIDFLDNTQVGGQIQNNNSNAIINIEDNFTVNGNLQNNSGASINIKETSTTTIDGNFSNNNSSLLNILGRLNINATLDNNGGTLTNNGILEVLGRLTQNDGVYQNDGVALLQGDLRINGNGTVNGEGLIRTNNITNYGTFSGKNDVCALDDSSMPSQSGGGNYSSTTTYCQMSASEALPIVLDYFRVESSNGAMHFFWKTLAEINNDFFTVEYSENGKQFTPLFTVQGSGNSNVTITYEKTIIHPNHQNGYYRLKQTDFDNKFSYSKVVFNKHKNDLPKAVNAYPNPNDGGRLFVELKGLEAGQYTIGLLNSKGALIKEENIFIETDALYFETEILHGSTLNPDLYYIRISSKKERFLKKLVVK